MTVEARVAIVTGAATGIGRDCQRLIAETVKAFGRLDILINSAGIEKEMPFKEMPFLETPLDLWNKVIAVNLTGPWLCSQAAAKQMVSQGKGGRIINISSVHEDRPMPTNPLTARPKAAGGCGRRPWPRAGSRSTTLGRAR